MRSFCPVVQPFVCPVIRIWSQTLYRLDVAAQFIRDQHTWVTKRLSQKLQKSPRCLRIAMLLNQNVQCIPICIDRAPEPIFLAIDWNYDLIQMPFIRRTRPVTSYAVSKMSTETVYPKPDRFAADNQATLGKKIFYIRSAQCKAIIRPHRVGDHLSRKTETFETRQGTWYLHAY